MQLIDQLKDQLGVTDEQAKGGAGLLFKMAKDKLSGEEYSQVQEQVPESEELIDAAPAAGGLGGLLSKVGIGGDAGGLAGLAEGFGKLGISPDKIQGFVQTVLNFIKEKGGDKLQGLLSGVFN